MTQEELYNMNVNRIKVQLKEFFDQLKPEIVERCRDMTILDSFGNKISLDDINFNESCIFVSDFNILPYFTIYALQKINKVCYPDPSISGHYSRITTDYLYVESNEARYSKLDLSSVQMEVVPEMYKPNNYLFKELLIWRLSKDVGQGVNENMYRLCNERLEERYYKNLKDWAFFIGTLDEFKATYNTPLPIPVYEVKSNVSILEDTSKF